MPTGAGSGVFMGVKAARARQGGTQSSRGVSMFSIFPKLIIPMVIYAVIALLGAADTVAARLADPLFEIGMMSGATWGLTPGDLILIIALFFLFIEIVKSSDTGTASIINHGMSMLVFVIGLVLFLLVGRFATSVFFLLTVMALLDTVAGFVVTIVAARRDLAVGGDA